MSSIPLEVEARAAVQRLHQLRGEVDLFAKQARLLASSKSLGPLPAEADKLKSGMSKTLSDFLKMKTLSKSLSSRPPAGGGMPPAAKWGNELRAASKQLMEALGAAEKEIQKLSSQTGLQVNAHTYTETAPENLADAWGNMMRLLALWIEHRKRLKK